jgi:hypothetical protein
MTQRGSPLLSFTNGLVVLSGTDLATPSTNLFVGITNNVITATNGSLTLTINQGLGEITGSFIDLNGNNNSI